MLEIIITSSILIIALVLFRCIWGKKVSHSLRYALWLIVAVRLLVPVGVFENPFNVMNKLVPMIEGTEEWAEDTRLFGECPGLGTRILSNAGKAGEPAGDGAYEGNSIGQERGTLTYGERDPLRYSGGLKGTQKSDGSLTLKEMEGLLDGREILKGISLKSFLRYLWYAGMAVMAFWIAGCNVLFRCRIMKSRVLIGREGGLKVYIAEGLGSSCLLGVFCPVVCLTPDSVRSPKHREHTIAHELTHYRHRDHIWALVRTLCLVIYWFDPFVWLAVYLAARDCEMACDEGVIRRLGEEERQAYGCTLIEAAGRSKEGLGLLRCAAGMNFGKRELRNRISQIAAGTKKTGILIAVLVAVCGAGLAACTFGAPKEEAQMGRYVETAVELPGTKGKRYLALSQEGSRLRLFAAAGVDVVSSDGKVFEPVKVEDMPSGAADTGGTSIYSFAGSMSGTRAYMGYDYNVSADNVREASYFLTGAGEKLLLDALAGDFVRFFYSGGSFYTAASGEAGVRYYRMDPATGEMELLLESERLAYHIAEGDGLLYLLSSDGVVLYDLERKAVAEEQDSLLSEFVAGKWGGSFSEVSVLCCPYGGGLYLLTHQGIYWHELYSDSVDRVVDGGLCSIGDTEKAFTGMALLETEGEPEFLVLYDGEELMRYTYDAGIPSVPEALRVYSVYEDSQIIRAVSAFRRIHPEIPVVYEVGMNESYGATVDDVLKNLATEIAAGNGPDILVMDDIPYESYVEKGVLKDLAYLREEMTEEQYFVKVIDGFAREDGLYSIPMTFSVPVLGGLLEDQESPETLEELGDLLEAQRAKGEGDYVFCTWNAESTLRLLAQSSQGAWLKEGELDREAVEEFLTQAKRIYDTQFAVRKPFNYTNVGSLDIAVEESPQEYGVYITKHDAVYTKRDAAAGSGIWMGKWTQYPLARRFDSDGIFVMIYQTHIRFAEGDHAYYAGFMSIGEEDCIMGMGIQKAEGESCVRMPGQRYGACLASSLLAIREGTTREEECRMFLEYAVSKEFLADGHFNGTPVNKEAYEMKKAASIARSDRGEYSYCGFGGNTEKGNPFLYDIDYLDKDDYEELDKLLEGITGVNVCDAVVYETVVEYGQAALTGESSVKESVDAIEKRLKIYLAE